MDEPGPRGEARPLPGRAGERPVRLDLSRSVSWPAGTFSAEKTPISREASAMAR